MKKIMKKNKNKRLFPILVTTIVLILVVVTYNLIWFFYIQKPYSEYTDGLKQSESNNLYIGDSAKYSYEVSIPRYINFFFNEGKLEIADKNSGCRLYVYNPSNIYLKKSYMLFIIINDEAYTYDVDKQLHVIDKSLEHEYEQAFNVNEENIINMIKHVNGKWELQIDID